MVLRARLTLLAALAAAVGACSIERAPSGRPAGVVAAPPSDSAATAEVYAALRLYYSRVTARRWKEVATSFWPRAAITAVMTSGPATAPARMQTVTVEQALRRASARKDCPVSFSDEIARVTVVAYGPRADAWVTYRMRCGVRRDSLTTHYGIDALHLVKHDGEWRIAGLIFTNERAGEPLSRQ